MTSTSVTPRRRPNTLALLAGLLFALSPAACDSPSVGTPTASTPAASAPATADPTAGASGRLHMIAEPGYDHRRVELAYFVGSNRIKGESIDEDVEIIVNREFPPGQVRVEKNGLLCDGVIEILSDVETDVLLDFALGDAGHEVCEVFTTETHPPGSIAHPELPLTAAVGAFLPFGMESVFVVRSLDDPDSPPIAEITVSDPPYEAAQIVVEPGRYETSVLVDGVVIARDTVDLERGEDRIMFLRVLPPDVPRDCGDTPETICELVVNAGYMWGLFPGGREVVTAVSVRPSQYMSCMQGIESPLYDLVFEVANPKGDLEATVGRYENGRYTACTY